MSKKKAKDKEAINPIVIIKCSSYVLEDGEFAYVCADSLNDIVQNSAKFTVVDKNKNELTLIKRDLVFLEIVQSLP